MRLASFTASGFLGMSRVSVPFSYLALICIPRQKGGGRGTVGYVSVFHGAGLAAQLAGQASPAGHATRCEALALSRSAEPGMRSARPTKVEERSQRWYLRPACSFSSRFSWVFSTLMRSTSLSTAEGWGGGAGGEGRANG